MIICLKGRAKRPWDIIWAHAVNDSGKLEQCCESSNVMVIEGDISLREGNIVMAHDPLKEVDITFNTWIEKIATTTKGAKLDFKDPLSISPCLEKLQNLNLGGPIFLHADILRGPGGGIPKFDPSEFIELCKEQYPKGILSLGWTTEGSLNVKYTENMICQMLETVKDFDYLVTFSIRACYVRSSYLVSKMLLQGVNHTITIWNNESVPDDLKSWIKYHFDHDKTFYDLIDEKGNPISL